MKPIESKEPKEPCLPKLNRRQALSGLMALVSFSLFSPKVYSAENSTKDIGIGRTNVQLCSYGNPNSDIVYVNMHDNENTSVKVARKLISQGYGGHLLELKAQGRREITFEHSGQEFKFDPNRIFTNRGIRQTLTDYENYSIYAHLEVRVFAKKFLQEIDRSNPTHIVALHNNSNNKYSIKSYLSKNTLENDAQRINYNPNHDPDNFFYVTDESVFLRLKEEKFNVVLQNDLTVTDDGSLSVYCAREGISYINVEAQHSKRKKQEEMLKALVDLL
jgi:hypothetical protein